MQSPSIAIFGEVLFDCFADGHSVLGGAPFNVAWHLQALTSPATLISRIGSDAEGDKIQTAIVSWGMSQHAIQLDAAHPTGKVLISLTAGEPSYTILDNQAYDFIQADQLPVLDGQLLYHGSLALRHPVSSLALQTLKNGHHGKIFMDVNLRAPWWDVETLAVWMADADWIKLNHEELQLLQSGQQSIESKMQDFLVRYQLQGLVVTLGERGALGMLADGQILEISPTAKAQVIDTVGAGDAFSAVLLLGLQRHWPLNISMLRAQSFASAIVQQQGAIVSDRAFYQGFIDEWLL